MYRINNWHLAVFCCLVTMLLLIKPTPVLADPPTNSGAEQCVECHQEETEAWLASPHAMAVNADTKEIGATCEGCHGAYVEGHPEAGIMSLTVDSSPCEECHATTFEQWENTTHAEAGVSCIGCHKSHSLQFRLSDSDHCGSCHKERQQDFGKSAHALADVACTDCHLSSTEAATEDVTLISDRTDGGVQAPSHDFTKVSAEDCIKCHTQNAHRGLPATSDKDHVEKARMVAMAGSVPQLAARLETSERKNQSLMLLTPAMLGLGIAVGGAIGITSVMLFCYINQKKGAQQ